MHPNPSIEKTKFSESSTDLSFQRFNILLMPKQVLQYQLAELEPEDFVVVPGLNFAIAKAKTRASDGKVLTRISWYETKLLAQGLDSDYFLPTASQWDKAREYLQKNHPDLEKVFLSGEYEWLDSLLAFPNEQGEYSPKLQLSGIGNGKDPLLIEQSKVERSGESYVLTEGKVIEVPELPLKHGYIQAWDKDLGLPTKLGNHYDGSFEGAHFWVNTNYDYHEGLRSLFRGPWRPSHGPDVLRRFDTAATLEPSYSASVVGLRLARAIK
jgi:hypothetical protein